MRKTVITPTDIIGERLQGQFLTDEQETAYMGLQGMTVLAS